MLTPVRAYSIAAMRTARKIRKELDEGAEFSELIEKYTTNEELRNTEGYMVWLRPDEMLDEFQQAVSGLKPGDVTEPFSSILGYHVVLVDSVNYDPGHMLQGFPPRIEQKLREGKRVNERRYPGSIKRVGVRFDASLAFAIFRGFRSFL